MIRPLLLALSLSLLLVGCSDTINGKALAEPAAVAFHESLNAGKFADIYDGTNEAFKNAAPKDKVVALFAAIQRKLGRAETWNTVSWNVKTFNLVTNVVLVQETKFEQGTATETFTFRVDDGKVSLVGYTINSLDMLIK